MKNKYKRAEKSSFQYRLISGIFALSALIGLFFCCVYFREKGFMFWAYVVWTLFFTLAFYCWIDEKRYEKFEYYMTPVIFGLLFFLFVGAGVGCLIFNVLQFFKGEGDTVNLIGGLIGAVSCEMSAYFSYVFYLKDYISFSKKK